MLPELDRPLNQEPAADQVLRQVVSEVLETMFFSEGVPTDCAHDWIDRAGCARVSFEGSHCGEMRLATSGEAATSIACCFLGAEPDELDDAQRSHVMLELANILY